MKIPQAFKREIEFEAGKTYSICKCGRSRKAPLCDGSHFATGHRSHKFFSDKTETKKVQFDEDAMAFVFKWTLIIYFKGIKLILMSLSVKNWDGILFVKTYNWKTIRDQHAS